jgi:hypothetical protein
VARPASVEALQLAQQATLETRDAKHEPRSLAEQRTTWKQGKIDDGAVDDGSVASTGGREEALLGVEDALGGVEVGTGDGVYRRPVDPPQRARFFDAVRWCGQGY